MTAAKSKTVLALSGGMDSATLLAMSHKTDELHPVSFYYASKHGSLEQQKACELALYYDLSFSMIDLTGAFSAFRSDLLKTGGAVPEGHYEDASMSRTVVPGRNLIFAAVLAGLAESVGASTVLLGVHAGDHHIYPDCRPTFVYSLNHTVQASTEGRVSVVAPFLKVTKTDILRHGLDLKVPYHMTRTCYTDDRVACGRCGSCQERLEAFAANGVADPLEYATREIMPKAA